MRRIDCVGLLMRERQIVEKGEKSKILIQRLLHQAEDER
jgi:hypothetical protein